ncbi:MAG TPA: nuclear transport factor 2 family protein [Puia sp.]|nr:nuclear transport factor 2 family protein [Puia sp.]
MKESRSVAITWVDLLNKHDSTKLSQLYSENTQINSPNWGGTKTGRAEVKTIYNRYFVSTPDLSYIINNIIATDTAAVVEYNFSGTLANPESTTPAYMKGKKYNLKGCTVIHIRKGKIIRQDFYFDQVTFLRQMGFFDQK